MPKIVIQNLFEAKAPIRCHFQIANWSVLKLEVRKLMRSFLRLRILRNLVSKMLVFSTLFTNTTNVKGNIFVGRDILLPVVGIVRFSNQ